MGKLNVLVAASTNNVIGKANTIPWRLPTDMKYFKKITEGHIVIMGRKSWDSLPVKFRPLPNRTNVIVTRNESFKEDGVIVFHDLDYCLNHFQSLDNSDEVFIIGGSEIYKAAFPFADKLYLTRVLAEVDGDVYLEGFDASEWSLASSSEVMEENGLKFIFEVYEK